MGLSGALKAGSSAATTTWVITVATPLLVAAALQFIHQALLDEIAQAAFGVGIAK